MKRILTCFLAFVLVLGLGAPAPAQAATGGKLVALTFDDGPGRDTARLLDGLKARGVKATFFLVGQQIKRFPGVAERIYREGHELANHSVSHANLKKLSDSGVLAELQPVNQTLSSITGGGTRILVRAPGGNTNEHVRSLAGAPFIYWSTDTKDYLVRNAAKVRDSLVSGCYDGAILLLHDIHSTSVDAALMSIDILKEKGYEFVTVSELFRRRGVPLENGVTYYNCKPTGKDLGPVTAPSVTSRVLDGKLELTLTAQAGAKIYYSLTGPELNGNSKVYTGPIQVTPPCTIWAAAAYDMNGSRSDVTEKSFPTPVARTPRIEIADGTLTLSGGTAGAGLYYTLDGTTATEQSVPYTAPAALEPGTVVSACAGGSGFLTSPASRAYYSPGGTLLRDVFPENWYCEAVLGAASAGLMNGQGDGVFAPEDPLTRGQLAALLYRLSGEAVTQEERDACPFRDLEPDSFYADAVCWAGARGIVDSGDSFRPDSPATRQELSKFLVNYLLSRGLELPGGASEPPAETPTENPTETPAETPEETPAAYTDADQIAPWALPYVEAASAWGLLQGDGEGAFRPYETATRAQAAAVLLRLRAMEPAEPAEQA